MNIVYLTSDLIFASRVRSLATSLDVHVELVNSRTAALDLVASLTPRILIVDLEHREADCREIKTGLSALSIRCPTTVAYAPHVKEQLLTAAQAAGCDLVLSRGQFDKQFASILRAHITETERSL